EVTFFDWPRAIRTRPGAGTIAATGLRVPGAALDWWARRFDTACVPHEAITERAGRRTLAFADPEGQRLVLVDDGGAPGGAPWPEGPVLPEMAIGGLGPTALTVTRSEPTAQVLTAVLGFREVGAYAAPEDGQPVRVFAVGAGGPGAEVHVAERPDAPRGAVGIGGVHHIAFRTPDA